MSNLYLDLPKPIKNNVKEQTNDDGIQFKLITRKDGRYSYTKYIEWHPIKYDPSYPFNHNEESSSECLEDELINDSNRINKDVLCDEYIEFKEGFEQFKNDNDDQYQDLDNTEDDSEDQMEQLNKLRLAYEKITTFIEEVNSSCAPNTKYDGKYDRLSRYQNDYKYQKDEDENYFCTHIR